MADPDVLVVGAGVTGLTTALTLADEGFSVEILSAEQPEHTTSAAAGAMWGPYLVEPADKVAEWSNVSLAKLTELARHPETGVRIVEGIEAARTPADPPPWADRLPQFRLCEPEELPDGFVDGWRFASPMIEMHTYLTYLVDQLRRHNVAIKITEPVASLPELEDRAPVIVNCSGSGARDLTPDPDLTVIKGHLVFVDNPGIDDFFSEETGDSPNLTHLYPQGQLLVLGGLAEPDNWDRTPDPATTQAVLQRCAAIRPELDGRTVRFVRTGLRPTRAAVRLDSVVHGSTKYIHNYGHGGAGVTLSWGCAREIARIARSAGL